jgi:hypothetical protein
MKTEGDIGAGRERNKASLWRGTNLNLVYLDLPAKAACLLFQDQSGVMGFCVDDNGHKDEERKVAYKCETTGRIQPICIIFFLSIKISSFVFFPVQARCLYGWFRLIQPTFAHRFGIVVVYERNRPLAVNQRVLTANRLPPASPVDAAAKPGRTPEIQKSARWPIKTSHQS